MTLNKIYIVGIIVFLFLAPVYSQTEFIEKFYGKDISKKFTIEQWTTDDGLPQNSINDITQSPDGFLWLATEEGIVRFDGKNFSAFNIGNTPGMGFNRVRAIAADDSGGIWIGGESGEIAYLKNNNVTDFSSQLPENFGTIYGIKLSPTAVYIFIGNSLLKYDGKDFLILFKGKDKYGYIRDILVLDNDEIIVSNSEGLLKIKSSGEKENISKSIISDVLLPLNENEILVEYNRQLFVFSLKKKSLVKSVSEQRENSGFKKLILDKKGNKWWGSYNLGLFVIPKNSGEVRFNKPELIRTMILAIFEDYLGNIWIGTSTKGLFKISERFFYHVSLYNGKFNDILNQIYQRKNGDVWVASNCSGVAEIKGNDIKYYLGGENKKNNHSYCIWSICETSDNSLYLGTYRSGIFKFDQNSREKIFVKNSKSAFSFLEDGDSLLAVGIYGLSIIKKDKAEQFNSEVLGEKPWLNTIVKDKNGQIWVGGKKGLYKFNGNDFEKVELSSSADNIPVRPIYFDENNRMFVGTYGYGLFVMDSGKFYNIKKENGLFDNTVHTFFEDSHSNFWMTSNHGIFVVRKEEIISFVKNESKEINSSVFTKKFGFPNNEFNGGFQPAHQYLDDGTLLFPSIDGIVAVDVNNIDFNNNPPKIIVEKFLVDGEPHLKDEEIIVHSGYRDIEIGFTASDLSGLGDIKFKYKIDGLDEDWSRPNSKRSILLKSVAPGNYVLKVKAKNSFSPWSKASKGLSFTVEPIFYQTLIFKILIFFLFALVVFGISYFYVKIQRRISKRLGQIVKQRTYELQAEVAKKENALKELKVAKEEEERQRKLAEKLNKDKTEMFRIISHNLKNPIGVIRSSANLMNDGTIDQKVKNELKEIIVNASDEALSGIEEILHHSEVEDLEFKLSLSEFEFCKLVESVIERNLNLANNKNQRIIFNGNGGNKILVAADYEKLFLAIDNFLSNGIKYSPIGEDITLKIKPKSDEVYLGVSDNGPGVTEEDKKNLFGKFKKLSARPTGNESSSGLGLSIAKRIIELHNGKVGVISDGKEKGAEFFFIIPLSQK